MAFPPLSSAGILQVCWEELALQSSNQCTLVGTHFGIYALFIPFVDSNPCLGARQLRLQ